MPRVSVELGDINVRWGDSPHLYRDFSADAQRAGHFVGELLGSTRMLRVEFVEGSGLEPVDIEQGTREEPLDYLDKIKDDRKARRMVSAAVRSVLSEREVAEAENLVTETMER